MRYHRKAVKSDDIPKFTLFKRKQVIPLIQILRLAVLLNNQRQSTTKRSSLRLETNEGHWTLFFPRRYLTINTLMQLDLEKEQAYWDDARLAPRYKRRRRLTENPRPVLFV